MGGVRQFRLEDSAVPMDRVVTPYHRINRNFLTIIGLWPLQPRLSRYFWFAIIMLLTITHGYLQVRFVAC